MTTATLGKWGNASAIRIPRAFCEQMGIRAGDDVSLFLDGTQRLIIEKAANPYTIDKRMKGWTKGRLDVPEYDWGMPVGKELW